jgi:hypothetical protein
MTTRRLIEETSFELQLHRLLVARAAESPLPPQSVLSAPDYSLSLHGCRDPFQRVSVSVSCNVRVCVRVIGGCSAQAPRTGTRRLKLATMIFAGSRAPSCPPTRAHSKCTSQCGARKRWRRRGGRRLDRQVAHAAQVVQLPEDIVADEYLSGKPHATLLGKVVALVIPPPMRFVASWVAPLTCLLAVFAPHVVSLAAQVLGIMKVRRLDICWLMWTPSVCRIRHCHGQH